MGGTGSYMNKLKLTTIITGIIACSSSTLFAQDKVEEFFKSIGHIKNAGTPSCSILII